jgi:hypothetical protein
MTVRSLRQAAENGIKKAFHCQASGGAIKIIETSCSTKNSQILVKPPTASGGLSAFAFDVPRVKGGGDPIFPYFVESVEGLCKKCDAILVIQREDSAYVISAELKSTNIGGVCRQLAAGLAFSRFLAERLRATMDAPPSSVKFGAVVFAVTNATLKSSKAGKIEILRSGTVSALVVRNADTIYADQIVETLGAERMLYDV